MKSFETHSTPFVNKAESSLYNRLKNIWLMIAPCFFVSLVKKKYSSHQNKEHKFIGDSALKADKSQISTSKVRLGFFNLIIDSFRFFLLFGIEVMSKCFGPCLIFVDYSFLLPFHRSLAFT